MQLSKFLVLVPQITVLNCCTQNSSLEKQNKCLFTMSHLRAECQCDWYLVVTLRQLGIRCTQQIR